MGTSAGVEIAEADLLKVVDGDWTSGKVFIKIKNSLPDATGVTTRVFEMRRSGQWAISDAIRNVAGLEQRLDFASGLVDFNQ
jgi:hypothetical protein